MAPDAKPEFFSSREALEELVRKDSKGRSLKGGLAATAAGAGMLAGVGYLGYQGTMHPFTDAGAQILAAISGLIGTVGSVVALGAGIYLVASNFGWSLRDKSVVYTSEPELTDKPTLIQRLFGDVTRVVPVESVSELDEDSLDYVFMNGVKINSAELVTSNMMVNPVYANNIAVRTALNLDGGSQVVLMSGTFRDQNISLGTITENKAYAETLARQRDRTIAVLGDVYERGWVDVKTHWNALKPKS